MPGIIVGVDGSDHSLSALDWALNEADLRKTPLTVITVSPIVSGIYGPGYAPADYFPAEEEGRAQSEKATQELVNQAVERRGGPPGAPVTVRALTGTAADELINASEDADLLVVGAGGRVVLPGWCWAQSAPRSRTTRCARSWSCRETGRNEPGAGPGRPGLVRAGRRGLG